MRVVIELSKSELELLSYYTDTKYTEDEDEIGENIKLLLSILKNY